MNTLQYGCHGPEVKTLQHYLNLIEDGIFGRLTHEAVLAFQRDHSLTADGLVGPNTWAVLKTSQDLSILPVQGGSATTSLPQGDAIPTLPDGSLALSKTTRKINSIILHCTATREGQDCTVARIKGWHLSRGWSDIGYHYVIYRDGSIRIARDINKIGAHTSNHNTGSIGICYVGGCQPDSSKSKDTRTKDQRASLTKLVRQLQRMYYLSDSQVHAHYEYADKACPSFPIDEFRKELHL